MKSYLFLENHMKSFDVVLKSQKSIGNHIIYEIIENHKKIIEIYGNYVEIIEKHMKL